jgi:hypothetical protein
MAKATVLFDGSSGAVVSCFNSTLSGAAATTAPCGFGAHKWGTGDYTIDFGFQADDRFFSLTIIGVDVVHFVCTDAVNFPCNNSNTPNQVEVVTYSDNLKGYFDAKFYLIVY